MRRIDPRIPIGVAVGAAVLAIAVLLLGDRNEGRDVDEGPAVARSEFYGVNAPRLRGLTEARREALDAHAREIAERGIGWVRIVFDQRLEQPAPAETDWAIPDEFVAALARHGLRTAAVFVGTAPWAASPDAEPECAGRMQPPADVEAWASFLGEAAARYGPDGEFWSENPDVPELPILDFEVGNEPNVGRLFWCPVANPEQYAAVYDAAHDAIVRANPEARPVVGGLAPAFFLPAEGSVTVQEFLRRMLAADPTLAERIEAVAVHPYGPTPQHVLLSVRAFRGVLRANGLGKTPMIANETGWYTQGPPGTRFADEETRARFIAEVASVIDRTDCGIDRFAIHAWLSLERNPRMPAHWYGIADPRTGAPDEAAVLYGRAIAGGRRAESATLARTASNLCS